MSEISSNSHRRRSWKISQLQSKSIVKDQKSISIYKLPSKFQPTKLSLAYQPDHRIPSLQKQGHSQIINSKAPLTESSYLESQDRSMLNEDGERAKKIFRVNHNMKSSSIKDNQSAKKRTKTQSNHKDSPMQYLRYAKMQPSNAQSSNFVSKIKSQFIVFKQKILKDLKQMREMIQSLGVENAGQIERGLKQIEISVLNNELMNGNRSKKDVCNDGGQEISRLKSDVCKNRVMKLQSEVIKMHFSLNSSQQFKGSFGCIKNSNNAGNNSPSPSSSISLPKPYTQSLNTPRKLQFQPSKPQRIATGLVKLAKQQSSQICTKSTLDRCNQMVETIVTLSEINSSPVVTRSCSNDNLMVEEYRRRLLQISKSNQRVMEQQGGRKAKAQPRMRVNEKLQKFYTAIEKLKQDVNEIRNISDIKQVRKKYV